MKTPTIFQKTWSSVLCLVLAAAAALTLAACGSDGATTSQPAEGAASAAVSEVTSGAPAATELGTGKTTFPFAVKLEDGSQKDYIIHTDEKTVGAALLALQLIDGDEGEYGLYVKTVDGVTADYDKDKTYWAFYVNGEYAVKGVDQTKIEPDAAYAFAIAK